LARSAFDRALASLRAVASLHGVEAELLGLALPELLLNGEDVARLVLPVLASSPSAYKAKLQILKMEQVHYS
jgi:hypothetical protein